MGKGVSWSAKERECAALAWFRATNNATVGADQRMEDFQKEIFSNFKVLTPTTTGQVRAGTYEERTPTAVYSTLQDIFRDIGNFYKALTLVNNSNPTGVNADNKLSMAIAIHTVKEVNRLDYNYRDYDHYKWVNYLAWKVLRYSPKYRPPSPPSTEHDNTSPPAEIDSVSMAEESPFPPDSANTNTAILQQIATNLNPSPPAAVAAVSTVATSSSAAVGHDNNLSSSTSSKKRAFVPADPALGGRGAEMGAKKAKKENDKIRAEEMKEKRFNELKDELREQTKTQKRLVRLFELRTLIKTAMMTKNKKLLKDANDEMAKFLGASDSSPTDDADADDDDDDDDDDEFPPTIPRAGV